MSLFISEDWIRILPILSRYSWCPLMFRLWLYSGRPDEQSDWSRSFILASSYSFRWNLSSNIGMHSPVFDLYMKLTHKGKLEQDYWRSGCLPCNQNRTKMKGKKKKKNLQCIFDVMRWLGVRNSSRPGVWAFEIQCWSSQRTKLCSLVYVPRCGMKFIQKSSFRMSVIVLVNGISWASKLELNRARGSKYRGFIFQNDIITRSTNERKYRLVSSVSYKQTFPLARKALLIFAETVWQGDLGCLSDQRTDWVKV